MLKIFMIILILISIITIYFEVKNRERSDKIFYTFYIFVTWIILLPIFWIFDSVIAYSIFTFIYWLLIYSIYTDFEMFTRFSEIFLVSKKINKKEILKIDYEFLELLKNYFKGVIKNYNIKIYSKIEKLIDKTLILAWIITAWILIYQLIYTNVL